jgi:hypothetical protein
MLISIQQGELINIMTKKTEKIKIIDTKITYLIEWTAPDDIGIEVIWRRTIYDIIMNGLNSMNYDRIKAEFWIKRYLIKEAKLEEKTIRRINHAEISQINTFKFDGVEQIFKECIGQNMMLPKEEMLKRMDSYCFKRILKKRRTCQYTILIFPREICHLRRSLIYLIY